MEIGQTSLEYLICRCSRNEAKERFVKYNSKFTGSENRAVVLHSHYLALSLALSSTFAFMAQLVTAGLGMEPLPWSRRLWLNHQLKVWGKIESKLALRPRAYRPSTRCVNAKRFHGQALAYSASFLLRPVCGYEFQTPQHWPTCGPKRPQRWHCWSTLDKRGPPFLASRTCTLNRFK